MQVPRKGFNTGINTTTDMDETRMGTTKCCDNSTTIHHDSLLISFSLLAKWILAWMSWKKLGMLMGFDCCSCWGSGNDQDLGMAKVMNLDHHYSTLLLLTHVDDDGFCGERQ